MQEPSGPCNERNQFKVYQRKKLFLEFRSEEITFYPSKPNGDDDSDGPGVVFIIVVSVVSVLFLVLIVTCISYHCLKRAKRYKNVPDYESGKLSKKLKKCAKR